MLDAKDFDFLGHRHPVAVDGCTSTSDKGAEPNPGRARSEDATDVAQPRRARRRAESVHPWRPAVLPPCPRGGRSASSIASSNSASRDGGRENTRAAGLHGRSCRREALWRQHGLERWNLPATLRPADSRRARERRGKPYAGNPHVRFDEGPLARAFRTAGWGLLHQIRRRIPECFREW